MPGSSLLLLALALLGGDRPEDEVLLKNGRTLSGHVVYEDDERLLLLDGTREREVEREDVERVDSVVRSLEVVLGRLTQLAERDVAGLLDLARYCRAHRLPGEAEVLAWSVLAVDGGNEEAHELLGHRRRGKSWGVRTSGRNWRFEDLARVKSDWGDAWEFTTTHYEVRTNIPLADAVRVTLDLERVYQGAYAFLGRELELRDVTRPLHAWVHADESSFPEATGGRRSYFSPQQEALIVNAGAGYDPRTLVHEAVHQFLWGTGPGRKSAKAVVPAWVDEGLAEYLAGGISGPPGRLSVDVGGVLLHHFREHASSRDPYSLSRVLAFGGSDFGASSHLSLKYAQSYTLVHFCLHGDAGEHRQAFFDFLRGCWKGQGSMTDFKRAIDVRERDFEAAWAAYVADHP